MGKQTFNTFLLPLPFRSELRHIFQIKIMSLYSVLTIVCSVSSVMSDQNGGDDNNYQSERGAIYPANFMSQLTELGVGRFGIFSPASNDIPSSDTNKKCIHCQIEFESTLPDQNDTDDSADILLNENDELTEFDDFSLDEDSADLNDEDYIGQIAPVYFFGCAGRTGIANGQSCPADCNCNEGCCEGGKCVAKKRDWANFLYCPADCRGRAFGSRGTR